MATDDVPGHKPANRDRLAMGCWAEHQDGSLVLVEQVEGDRVVYCMFDVSGAEPTEYRDAMVEREFKRRFSWPNDLNVRWTWHDKTPFPFDRVMRNFPAGVKIPSAGQQLSAAMRVAQSLGLQAQQIREELRHRVPRRATTIMQTIYDALTQMGS